MSLEVDEPAEVSDLLLYTEPGAGEVSVYLKSPTGVWYRFGTTLEVELLEAYVETVRERIEADGG